MPESNYMDELAHREEQPHYFTRDANQSLEAINICAACGEPAGSSLHLVTKTTGKITSKPYRCTSCDAISQETTNHWGEIYSSCRQCNWKRPYQATTKVCLEEMPEGYTKPEPWKIVRLGDIAEIIIGPHDG